MSELDCEAADDVAGGLSFTNVAALLVFGSPVSVALDALAAYAAAGGAPDYGRTTAMGDMY